MADMEGKVCPNHPEVEAVSRCVGCFKPLCQECVVKEGSQDFCSSQCATNHAESSEHFGDAQANERKRKVKKLIKTLVVLIIVCVAVVFGMEYYKKNKDSVDEKLKNAKEQAIEKTQQAQEGIDSAVDNAKERNSQLDKDYSSE
jgi:competence protein ComGC